MKNTTEIRDEILDALITPAAFEGWTLPAAEKAAVRAGHAPDMIRAVFPGGVQDIVGHFADRADRAMQAAPGDPEGMRVRDRITQAVQRRLEWLDGYKAAERQAVSFWLRPLRKYAGAKIVWRTADRIWNRAGDTATDYNHYTKRALLSGVLGSTTLYWLQDEGKDLSATFAFLDRRIDNALQCGKLVGTLKNFTAARGR